MRISRFISASTQAAANPYFVTAMKALEEHIAVGMRLHGLSLKSTQDGLQHVLVEHTAIYEAINNGDSEGARKLMHAHLTGSEPFVCHRADAITTSGCSSHVAESKNRRVGDRF